MGRRGRGAELINAFAGIIALRRELASCVLCFSFSVSVINVVSHFGFSADCGTDEPIPAQSDASRRGKIGLKSSRDKNKGTCRSGEGRGQNNLVWPWIRVTPREGERRRKSATIIRRWDEQKINKSRSTFSS